MTNGTMKHRRLEFRADMPFLVVLVIFGILPLRVISQQLDCNFDFNNLCNWSNGVNGLEDDFDWQIGNSVAVDGFHSIPRTVSGTGDFAYAQGKLRPSESDSAKAWLRSPTIDGLSRPATLTFNYWKTAAPPVLQVCTRDAGVSQLRCLDTISGLGVQQWTRREVVIPPNPLPFQIIFVATNFRTALDLIGLDDVQFRTTSTNASFLEDADTLQLLQLAEARETARRVQRRNDPVSPSAVANDRYSAPGSSYEVGGRPIGVGREATNSSAPKLFGTVHPTGDQSANTKPPEDIENGSERVQGANPESDVDLRKRIPPTTPQVVPQPQLVPNPPDVDAQSQGAGPTQLRPAVLQPWSGVPRPQQVVPQPQQLVPQPQQVVPQPQQLVPQPQQVVPQPQQLVPQPQQVVPQPQQLVPQQQQILSQQQQLVPQPQLIIPNPPVVPHQQQLPPQVLQQQEREQKLRQQQEILQLRQNQQLQQPQQQLLQHNFLSTAPVPLDPQGLPPVVQNGPRSVVIPQPQQFHVRGPQSELVIPNERELFRPPVQPPLLPLPVERSEPDVDRSRVSTQVINAFVQRTTAEGETKFTLPPNWFRSTTNTNEEAAVGRQNEVEEVTTVSSGGEHHHGDHHHHGEPVYGVCLAVTCQFESALCNWRNDLNANFDWTLKNNQSQYQGIPQDFSGRPSYVFVSGDQRRPDQKGAIRSQPFVAPSGAYLEFFSFLTDPTVTRLSAYRVNGNEQPNVLWQTMGNGQVEKNSWQRVRVPLPSSSFPTTLSIVADQLTTGQYIGIDELRLVDSNGVEVGCAADTAFTSVNATRVLLLTPFPPKEGSDEDLRPDLQLPPLKAAALLNNPVQEPVAPSGLLNTSTTNIGPDSQAELGQSAVDIGPPGQPNQQENAQGTAFIQQRRIGVIEARGLLGGDDNRNGNKELELSTLPTTITILEQQQVKNGTENGAQRPGVLSSIERHSGPWNVFQQARPDQLPTEIIFASQLQSPGPFVSTFSTLISDLPLTNPTTPAITIATSPRSLIDPVFPPGGSREINDQDRFYRRKAGESRRTPVALPLIRVESDDSGVRTIGSSSRDAILHRDVSTSTAHSTSTTGSMMPDPLGVKDFVSTLARDLQVLAGGGSSGNPWQQSGLPLSNFNYANSLNFPPSGTSALGLQVGGDLFNQRTPNQFGWLQSLLGKRKRK